jgi:hypothetical protein
MRDSTCSKRTTAREGVGGAPPSTPDLILMDIQLPVDRRLRGDP